MIVSVTVTDNREDQIADAIRSVVAHVDRVLIVDTGATDRTIERAREIAGDKLTVTAHRWVDFSVARNAGLDAAAELGAKWIVIVDSDERVDFGATSLRRTLARTRSDVLLIESDDGFYPKEKILRASAGTRFFGPTHEALIGGSRAILRGTTFRELPKTDEQLDRKYRRDLELLTSFVEEHPNDARWHYYLGVTLEGLDRLEEAAEAYGRCARLRKTGHEGAWASFKQAELLVLLERFEEAIAAAAFGMGANPTFAECPWIAAEAALKLGKSDQAIAWARIAESVGHYKGQITERMFFRYLPALYELPYEILREALPDQAGRERADMDFRAAQLARVRAIDRIGEHDLDWISVSRTVPESNRYEARAILRPPKLSHFCKSARATKIRFEPPGGRIPTNPSVCRHLGETWCVVRAVNYSMSGRHYTVHDPKGVVRTENYLGRLLPNGDLVDPTPMLDLCPSDRFPSQVVGYEDIRLVSIKSKKKSILTGSATVCDRDPEGRRLIARLHLSSDGDVTRSEVQPSNQLNEKNWMPLSVGGELTWIYSLDPTAILPGPLWESPLALDHLRGGAAIKFGDGYLCVVHEVIDSAPGGRIYLHRFVRLDNRFRVTGVSPSWVFAHHGVEFCAGLTREGSELVLSYGIEDREAWITRVAAEEVEAMKWITS